jgi:hypothetical protein
MNGRTSPLGWLRKRWRDWRTWRRLAREAHPRKILDLTREIREMAALAAQVCPREEAVQSRIQAIQTEMDRLAGHAGRPEFHRLPAGKRILLRQGLLQSRGQLLETMQAAPTPTRLLQ